MANHSRPSVPEHDQEVAEAGSVGAQRVVATWLGGLTMPKQVGREDRVAISQLRDALIPLTEVSGDPVNEQDHPPPFTGRAVAHPVAVEDRLASV